MATYTWPGGPGGSGTAPGGGRRIGPGRSSVSAAAPGAGHRVGSAVVQYIPYEQRVPDSQYRDLLARIVDQGEKSATRQGPSAITLMQQTMRFDLANGFPVITDRSVRSFWRKPIGELCAFINGATTLAELEKFGCDWWHAWATEAKTSKRGLPPGDIGPGSYGGA